MRWRERRAGPRGRSDDQRFQGPDRAFPRKDHVGPSHPGHLATAGTRLGAGVLDPETRSWLRTAPAAADRLRRRRPAGARHGGPVLDAEGRKTHVEERSPSPASSATRSCSSRSGNRDVPHRGKSGSLSPGREDHVTRVRLERDPEKAGKVPDAWRFLQDALTEPSERDNLLYDKLGLGGCPTRPTAPGRRQAATCAAPVTSAGAAWQAG